MLAFALENIPDTFQSVNTDSDTRFEQGIYVCGNKSLKYDTYRKMNIDRVVT